MRNFYEILQVKRDATKEEILDAYRRRVLETHPDRGGNPIEFQNVRKAYEVLSSDQRAAYDKWLNEKEWNEYVVQTKKEAAYPKNANSYKTSKEDKGLSSSDRAIMNFAKYIITIFAIIVVSTLIKENFPKKYDWGGNNNKESALSNKKGNDVKQQTGFIRDKEANHSNNEPMGKYEEQNFFSGDSPFKEYYGEGSYDKTSLCELKLINHTSNDAVVLLENTHEEIIRNVFVRNMDEYTIKQIPEGIYIVKIMYGNSWNPQKYNGKDTPLGGFMKNVSYSKLGWEDSFDFFFEKDGYSINYPTYSLTLHKIENGNISTEKINRNDFFN